MSVARGSITITDLTDGKSVAGFLETSQGSVQLNANSSGYAPDYEETPNIITPVLSISGSTERNYFESAPAWTVDGTAITATTDTYVLGDSSNNYALTIKKNLTKSTLLIGCSGQYVENGISTDVSMETTLTKVDNSGSGYKLLISTPSLVLSESLVSTTVEATLYNGVSSAPNDGTYQWQEYENGEWTNISNATNTTLTITRDMVETRSQFRCRCTVTATSEKVDGVIFISDIADEYQVSILGADKLKPASPSTELTVLLYADGVEVSTFSVLWKKFDSDGVEVSGWSSEANPLTVTRDMIEDKATFFVEVSI